MNKGWAWAMAVNIVHGFHMRGFDPEEEQFEVECFLVSGTVNT